jgi:hypothetical protein
VNVRDLWAALEADSREAAKGFLVRRIPGDRDLHLAIDKPTNRRALMLRIATSDLPAGLAALPEFAGFSVSAVPEAQTGRVSVHLVMGLAAFSEMFVVLVEDVVGRIVRADSDRSAAKALFERLVRWREFLKAYGPDGLDDEAQRGLYGELWFLRSELIPAVGEIAAINAWVGPLGGPQDFQMPGRSIETKVSTMKQLQLIRISNERQLDDGACGKLLLFHLSLDARNAGDATLPRLVQEVRELVTPSAEAATLFEDRLLAAGYHDAHSPRYARISYTQRERNIFLVRAGFPRITEDMLVAGTGDVSYSIAVSACVPFRVSDADAGQIIAGSV